MTETMTEAGQKKGDHPDRLVASSLSGILPNCCFPDTGSAAGTSRRLPPHLPSFLHGQAFPPDAPLHVPIPCCLLLDGAELTKLYPEYKCVIINCDHARSSTRANT